MIIGSLSCRICSHTICIALPKTFHGFGCVFCKFLLFSKLPSAQATGEGLKAHEAAAGFQRALAKAKTNAQDEVAEGDPWKAPVARAAERGDTGFAVQKCRRYSR